MPIILVVDDDPTVRAMTHLFLKKKGYSVIEATNGLEAEAIALATTFDLILLDVMMPKQDGYNTCINLRAKGYVGQILLVSALDYLSGETKAKRCGANGYLPKPISAEVLYNFVSQAVNAHG